MSESSWMEKAGATPAKLALVGCLAVGLVLVLWNQSSDGADKPVGRKNSPQTPQPQNRNVAEKTNRPKTLVSKTGDAEANVPPRQEWPRMPLERVVENDPFARPNWYLATLVTSTESGNLTALQAQQQLEELRKQQAKIVVISGGERIAIIGSESYRVGDIVAGFEITEINMDGVVLTETDR